MKTSFQRFYVLSAWMALQLSLPIMDGLAQSSLSPSNLSPSSATVEYLGLAEIPGNASDLSKEAGNFPDATPQDQLGGFSALAYSGQANRYYVLSDRGPDDGAVAYRCRFHVIDLAIDLSGNQPQVTPQLVATHLLTDQRARPFLGLATAFAGNDANGMRLDPEGIRVYDENSLVISDEYGPHLLVIDQAGRLVQQMPTPEHYRIANPASTKQEENALNTRGRQGNGGFEGVDLSPSHRYLYAITQGPMLQDHPFDSEGNETGTFSRILQRTIESSDVQEFAYPLDSAAHGVSEILCLDEQRLLVLERDGEPGLDAQCKAIYLADLRHCDPIPANAQLPASVSQETPLPQGIQPASKTMFLNLLDPRFGLAGEFMPKKIEGLTWGPLLPDGRQLLVVCSDNDFETDQPSRFYFFAVRRDDLDAND